MSHLLEILFSLFSLPSWRSRGEKSTRDESQLESQTRLFGWIFYGILALVVLGALIWCFA